MILVQSLSQVQCLSGLCPKSEIVSSHETLLYSAVSGQILNFRVQSLFKSLSIGQELYRLWTTLDRDWTYPVLFCWLDWLD